VYFMITIGMIVVLEVFPSLANYMPAISPLLALVGAFNLALISQQEKREAAARKEREHRKAERLEKRSAERTGERSSGSTKHVHRNVQTKPATVHPERLEGFSSGLPSPAGPVRKTNRAEALQDLTVFFGQHPEGSYSTAGRSVGRSKAWVVGALDELERRGLVRRDGKLIHVLEAE